MPGTVTKFENSPVRGFLHRPSECCGSGLALTHGAGSNCSAPLLITIASAFCEAGFTVLRFDLPFRQRRAHGPPYPSIAADDRAGVRAALDALRSQGLEHVFAAGHSYGGRQASMLAAEAPGVCDGLLLLSYPLHPPTKPDQPRTAHFSSLQVPTLFVHGTTDPFASPEELTAAVQIIPARTYTVFIERASHDLKHGKFDAIGQVVEPFRNLMTR